MKHEVIEKNVFLMVVLIVVVVSFGGLTEIVPLFFEKSTTTPLPGLKTLTALQLEGRDVYIKEGCHVCHTQMIRPLRAETERYGHYTLAQEGVYQHPFLWGSKRIGPDLARVGGRYSDEWHRIHLIHPKDVVPESIMPNYPWLAKNKLDGELTGRKMEALRFVGVPYTDDDIKNAKSAVAGKTELQAVIAYLQQLGTVLKDKR